MQLKNSISILGHVFKNIKRMLQLVWKMDRRLVIKYYLTGGLAALFPLFVSLTMKWLIDSMISKELINGIASIPLIIIIFLGLRYLVFVGQDFVSWGLHSTYYDHLFRYKLQNELNRLFYQKLAYIDIAHMEDPKTQDLIAKAKDTFTWRPPDFLRNLSYSFTNFISYVSAFIILWPFGWWIPLLITLVSIPRLYLRAKYGAVQWSLYGSGAPEVKKLWYFSYLLASPTAIREMKIFQSQETLLSKFKEIQNFIFNLNKKPLDNYIRVLTYPGILESVILFSIAYLQLNNYFTGLMTLGTFTLMLSMIEQLSWSTVGFVITFGEVYEHNLYVDHYFDVLELPELIKEDENPIVFAKIAPPKIEFKNVSFQYVKGKTVLRNVSFVINPGENVAFVGPNGAGKSTIVKLLCRFYDVTDGEILINGQNLKKLKLSNWYEFMGTLFQDFVQYHFTAKDNIVLGNPKIVDEKRMKEAAVRSGAYDFIKKYPKGFDQMLGREFEEGEELSIGQWQKLAIARAFYEEAPLLVLDEPTSAIDAESEYDIFNNLQKAYKNKSLILVSHRFSTVRNADKIFVIENGTVTESGTHKELIKAKGKYAKMFSLQAIGYQ